MPASFANIKLLLDTPEHEAFVAVHHDVALSLLSDNAGWNNADLDYLPLPSQPVEAPPEIGVLRWPTGASRCATAYFLVSGDQLADIRTAADASTYNDLVIDDGVNEPVTASMRMAVPLPIHVVGEDISRHCWLLRLVDRRYGWRHQSGDISSQPLSWAALFAAIGSGLGVSITTDTIDGDYDVPSFRWVVFQKSLPVLLDAAAYAVGHRVVVGLDGTVRTVRHATAIAAADAQFDADDFWVTIGGRIEAEDLQRVVPASVVVSFGETVGGVPQAAPHKETRTLASLAVTGYDGATGVAGEEKVLYADLVFDGSNGTAVDNFADQFAYDWYGWQLASKYDFTAPGIVPWTPTGAEDEIRWYYKHGGRLLTRVVRSPQEQRKGGFFPDLPVLEPLVRITSVGGAFGEFNFTYVVRQVTIDDTGVVTDVLPTVQWIGVVELEDRLLPASVTATPEQGLYTLSQSPDGQYYIDAEPTAGCGLLEVPATGEFQVDFPQLAGPGLMVVADGDCYQLAVDAGYLPGDVTLFGCGLVFDGIDTLSVDFSAVAGDGLIWSDCDLSVATGCGIKINLDGEVEFDGAAVTGDGLVWDSELCELSVATGCGIKINLDGEVEFDAAVVAGTASTSSLVTADTCELAVDLEPSTTTSEWVVEDVSLGLSGNSLCLTKTRVEYVNVFNAAGMIIDRFEVDRTTGTDGCFDICNWDACCDGTPPTAGLSVDDSTVSTGDTVTFTATASGGTSPYTFTINYGDGGSDGYTGSSPHNFTHSYSTAGTYCATLTVTDDCGRSDTSTCVTVTVGGGGGGVTTTCCGDNLVPGVLYVELSNGSDSCSCFDGKVVTITWNGTVWTGSVAGCGGTIAFTMTTFCSYGFTGDCESANETSTPVSCDTFNIVDTITVTGCCTGTVDIEIRTTP